MIFFYNKLYLFIKLCYYIDMRKKSKSFYKDAKSYLMSAEILIDSKERENDNQLLLVPILFLLRHSLELIIKAKIIKYIENDLININVDDFKILDVDGKKQKEKLLNTHSIKKLYDCLIYIENQNMITFFKKEIVKKQYKTINYINQLDEKSDYFRYPTNKNSKFYKRKYVNRICVEKGDYAPEISPNLDIYIGASEKNDVQTIFTAYSSKILLLQVDLIEIIEMLVKIY